MTKDKVPKFNAQVHSRLHRVVQMYQLADLGLKVNLPIVIGLSAYTEMYTVYGTEYSTKAECSPWLSVG